MPHRKIQWTVIALAALVIILVISLILVQKKKGHINGENPMGIFQIQAVSLGNKRFWLTRDLTGMDLEGQLMDIRFDGEDSLGELYRFELEDEIAESYPPQATAHTFEKIEDQTGRIAIGFDQAKVLTEFADRVVLIDVRTPDEFAKGRVPGAANLPLDRIRTDIQNFGTPEDLVPIVYCRSGARSKQAAQALLKDGFNLVFDAGGIMSYKGEIEK